MADILIKVDETVMPEIAQAIMDKTGKTTPLKITDFAGEISDITVGVTNEIARLYARGEYTPIYTGGLGEAGNYTPLYFGGDGIAGFYDLFPVECSWDFTKSLTDTKSSLSAKISAFDVDHGSSESKPVHNSVGITLNRASQYIYLGEISLIGKTIEIDVANFEFAGSTSYHIRFLTCNNTDNISSDNSGNGLLIWRFNDTIGWSSYLKTAKAQGSTSAWSTNIYGNLSGIDSINYFDNKTIKIVIDNNGTPTLYANNTLIGTSDKYVADDTKHIFIGGCPTSSYDETVGNQCYNVTISGVRIYKNK